MRGYFAQVRRAGFDIGISAGKLTRAMVPKQFRLIRRSSPWTAPYPATAMAEGQPIARFV
jgi:hypothetical protein